MSVPCAVEAEAFTSMDMCGTDADRLAGQFCDRCFERGACFRSAIRDVNATGVYGGCVFVEGVPAQLERNETLRDLYRQANGPTREAISYAPGRP